MEIIVGYGVSPWMERIIRYYWDHLSLVARAGYYYSAPFKGHQGVNQGGPLSPTNFNLLADAVICCWFMLVLVEEAVPDGFGWAVQWPEALFYANDVLLASPRPARLQVVLDVLIGLFYRFGLQTNVSKMVEMLCQT